MGMTKAALDFQIQQETQKSISELQRNMQKLDQVCRIIDTNMRHAFGVLQTDCTELRIRMNFYANELKNRMTEEEKAELEARFKSFMAEESEKINKQIAEVIAKREKAAAASPQQAGGPGSEDTPNVVQ